MKPACLGGVVGSVAVRAVWLRWSARLDSRPRLARSLCQIIAAYALRLNSQVGTEGSTVSSLRPIYSDATQLNSMSSWVASAGRYRHFADATPLDVKLSCVAIDTLTDATQLSPTIGNATDPVEQHTANQTEAGQSCFCSQCCIVMCDIPTSDVHFLRNVF